jgi:hypothetical protein
VPPHKACAKQGHASSEVTRAICRVPSASFSQAPWYALPVHQCRFRVRTIRRCSFQEPRRRPTNPIRSNIPDDPSHSSRLTNINVIPIVYACRPRLRVRLTLLRLTLSRNPWTFGGGVSHTPYVTHVSIRTSDTSSGPHGSAFTGLRNAPLPLHIR